MKFTTTLLIVLMAALSYGQTGSVQGCFQDSALKEGIPFANIDLLNTDSSLVASTATDFDGKFILPNIKPGVYPLNFKTLFYPDTSLSVVVLPSHPNLPLKTILLSGLDVDLSEIEVIHYKVPLIDK